MDRRGCPSRGGGRPSCSGGVTWQAFMWRGWNLLSLRARGRSDDHGTGGAPEVCMFYVEVGGTSPPIPKCGAAATTLDLWREFTWTLIREVQFSGLQRVIRQFANSARNSETEDPWVPN